jgi:hypothetical protein
VEFVEQLADGLAEESDRANTLKEMYAAVEEQPGQDPEFYSRGSYFAIVAARWAVASHADHVMGGALHAATAVGRQARAAAPAGADPRAVRVAAEAEESRWQRQLLRDLLGPLPFRPVTIAPSVRTWNDGTVLRLAESIYAERAFEQMGVLADALEEAGCHDAEILGHCRGPGPHVKGCWVIDLLTGRE